MDATATALTSSFRAGFGGTIRTSDDAGYEEARRVWNGTADERPAVIAECADVDDVVAALTIARTSGAPIALRGGGHSIPGYSTCSDGVVIDMSSMRAVTVDPSTRTAIAEPGARWADFDAATAAHGLASTGGLISSTGVAGLTLGGGIGWLQRKYGLACDNLRAAQVVTADGDVIEADDSLLWGLRGGGGNFGVVTRFTFDVHPVATIVGGLALFPFARGEEVFRAVRAWAPATADDLALLVAVITAPPEPFVPPALVGQKVIAVLGCWCGDVAEGERAIAPLRELAPAVDLFGPMPYPALQSMLDAGAPAGLRNYFRGGYVSDLTDDVIAVALEHGARMASPMHQLHFHQMGGAVSRYGQQTSSFSGREAGYTYNVIGTWIDPAEDGTHTGWARDTSGALAPLSLAGTYVNFSPEGGTQGAAAAYGVDIYERLARLKRQYDPHNLFRRNQNVLPAL